MNSLILPRRLRARQRGFIINPFGFELFPSVVNVANTTDTANGVSAAINLPSNLVVGNLLLMVVAASTSLSNIFVRENQSPTVPANWDFLYLQSSGGGGPVASFAWSRFITGSEGASVLLEWTANSRLTAQVLQIQDCKNDGGSPIVSPQAASAGTAIGAPDSPVLAPSWGEETTLWIAATGANNSITGYPTGYSGNQYAAGAQAFLGLATKPFRAASEDPSAFTSAAARSASCTIGIRPRF